MKKPSIKEFQKVIWDYYKEHKRDFPWRRTNDPYRILVSEVMLQQTQTYRVEPKYKSFLKKFPSLQKLAKARLIEILSEWKGLGYNRRAKALHQIAQSLIRARKQIPVTITELDALPGIGIHTAGSITTFAYNSPSVFIETNIRNVFIHFFFHNNDKVSDKDILPLVEATLDTTNPREWYWALMDYGAMLKKSKMKLNERSLHHRKQSKFEGSNRQLRSRLLDMIREAPSTLAKLYKLGDDKEKIIQNLIALEKEGFIAKSGRSYIIAT